MKTLLKHVPKSKQLLSLKSYLKVPKAKRPRLEHLIYHLSQNSKKYSPMFSVLSSKRIGKQKMNQPAKKHLMKRMQQLETLFSKKYFELESLIKSVVHMQAQHYWILYYIQATRLQGRLPDAEALEKLRSRLKMVMLLARTFKTYQNKVNSGKSSVNALLRDLERYLYPVTKSKRKIG